MVHEIFNDFAAFFVFYKKYLQKFLFNFEPKINFVMNDQMPEQKNADDKYAIISNKRIFVFSKLKIKKK